MGEQTNRAKVSVALIGVGPTWELHYREAVEYLSARLSVRAVCDPVYVRAVAIADEFQAFPVTSPWVLAQRKDLHAWLILDPGWLDTYPADLAVQTGRPTLFANSFSSGFPKLERLFRHSLESGETLMPEFPERFTAATIRLRELMATRLGPVRRIEIAVPAAGPGTLESWLKQSQPECIAVLDWCAYVVGHSVVSARIRPSPEGDQLHLNFAIRDDSHPEVPHAVINLFPATPDSFLRRTIHCQQGSATICSPTQIEWMIDDKRTNESLDHERSPQSIILDQFCRRALGGLLPVPTLKEALQAIAAAQLALAELQD
jgi:predicted dehydrogenase